VLSNSLILIGDRRYR